MSPPDSAPRGVKSMAVVRWVLVAAMALAAAASILSYAGVSLQDGGAVPAGKAQTYYCPMHPQVVQDHPGDCPICNMTMVAKTPGAKAGPAAAAPPQAAAGDGKFYCPMHPEVTSDDPNATCPKCVGMKLVPRPPSASAPIAVDHANHAAAAAVPGLAPVELSLDRIQLTGMRTAPATNETTGGTLRTVGVVAASERGFAQVTTRFAGFIETLAVTETGKLVRRGQVLATVYSPEVLRAAQELITARAWKAAQPAEPAGATAATAPHHELVSGLDGDARRRLELLGVSTVEIDDIARTGKPPAAVAVRAPADGHVITRNAVAGAAVQPGVPLFEIANLRSVWVLADVNESDVTRVRLGQPATLELGAFPGESFKGKVSFVYPTMDAGTRTLRVRLEFPNRSGAAGPKLRPGMYGQVLLALPESSRLVVPSEAVVDTGDLQYVFVARAGGRFEPRRVKPGAHFGDRTEILDGVRAGEMVVTTANFLVDSESRLRAAIEGQMAGGAGTGTSTGAATKSDCDTLIDGQKYPDKAAACRACEIQHRGMGTMAADCKTAIAKPWK